MDLISGGGTTTMVLNVENPKFALIKHTKVCHSEKHSLLVSMINNLITRAIHFRITGITRSIAIQL